MEDKKIINLLENKNHEALSIIIDKYGGLFSHIAKRTGLINQYDIEEYISDVVFKVWKKFKKYDYSKASFKTWIVLLARGCAIDTVRKSKKHKNTVSIEQLKEVRISYEYCSDYEKIVEIIENLEYPDNEIIYAKYVLGEDVKTIALRVNTSVDNVYKRIQRSKNDLLNQLVKEEII